MSARPSHRVVAVLFATIVFALVFTVIGNAEPAVQRARRGYVGGILCLLLICANVDVLPRPWSVSVALLLAIVFTLDRVDTPNDDVETFLGHLETADNPHTEEHEEKERGGGEEEDKATSEGVVAERPVLSEPEPSFTGHVRDPTATEVPLSRKGGNLSFVSSSSLESFGTGDADNDNSGVNPLRAVKDHIANRREQFQQQMARLNHDIDQMEQFYTNLQKDGTPPSTA